MLSRDVFSYFDNSFACGFLLVGFYSNTHMPILCEWTYCLSSIYINQTVIELVVVFIIL